LITNTPTTMNLETALWVFIDDLARIRGDYGVLDMVFRTPAEQALLERLQESIQEYFVDAGWRRPLTPAARQPAEQADAAAAPAVPSPDGHQNKDGKARMPDLRQEQRQLREAMRTRAVIEQAKGIAMARFGLSADLAWSYLVRQSQESNTKVRVIAEQLVNSVSVPAESPDGEVKR
jgi:hypothetical protein